MKNGGNKKLRDFLFQYNIGSNSPIDFKYKTKAGQYYRDMLKALVEQTEIPEPPTLEEGLELLNPNNPNFSSITFISDPNPQGIQSLGGSNIQNNEDYVEKTKKVLGNVLATTVTVSKNTYDSVSTKVKDPNFQNDVKEFGNTVKEKSIIAGKVGFEYAKIGFSYMKSGVLKAMELAKEQPKEENKVDFRKENPSNSQNPNPDSKGNYPDLEQK